MVCNGKQLALILVGISKVKYLTTFEMRLDHCNDRIYGVSCKEVFDGIDIKSKWHRPEHTSLKDAEIVLMC